MKWTILCFVLAAALCLMALPADAGGCYCACPGGTNCASTCSGCVKKSVSCTCRTGCSTGGCSSGYSEYGRSFCFCCSYNEKCRRTNCPNVNTNACANCKAGYYGSTCKACPGGGGSSACGGSTRGTCSDGKTGSGACSCNAGYNGNACQYSRSGTCNGHGDPKYDGKSCTCDQGFSGSFCNKCATNYWNYPTCKYCTSSHCNSHGSCNSNGNCVCTNQYAGTLCGKCSSNHYDYSTCKYCTPSSTCSNRGNCDGNGNCNCNTHHTGSNCASCVSGYYANSATNWNCVQCPGNGNCNGNGVCASGWGGAGTCSCTSPYRGSACIDPVITSISPQSTDTESGVEMVISGFYFGIVDNTDGVTFKLGSQTKFCATVLWDDQVIQCSIPAWQGKNLVVQVTTSTGKTSNTKLFSYNAPVLNSVSPGIGPVLGGTKLTIFGISFGTFGGTVKWTASNGGTQFLAMSKEGFEIGTTKTSAAEFLTPVGLGNNCDIQYCITTGSDQQCSGTLHNVFKYEPPAVTNVDPPQGSTAGGYQVEVQGVNFGPVAGYADELQIEVTLGSSTLVQTILGTNRDDGKARFMMPAGVGKGIPIKVYMPTFGADGVGTTAVTSIFEYNAPRIDYLTADGSGCVTSNISLVDCPSDPISTYRITLHGVNFGPSSATSYSPITILVDSSSCGDPQVVADNTAVSCLLPAGSRWFLPVTFSRPSYTVTLENAISYKGPFITPGTLQLNGGSSTGGHVNASSINGGDSIDLTGDFPGATSSNVIVVYGDPARPAAASYDGVFTPEKGVYNCTVTAASTTKITCTTTAGVGRGLRFQLWVDGKPSNMPTDTYSYPSAVISSPSLRLLRDGSSASTSIIGDSSLGENILFAGSGFGHTGYINSFLLRVTYGPANDRDKFKCFVDYAASSPTQIRCRTSPGVGEDLHFTVYTGPTGAQVASSPSVDAFSYPAPPEIYNVTGCDGQDGPKTTNCPTNALRNGLAIRLTINGKGFQSNAAAMSVTIGGEKCIDIVNTPNQLQTQITCELPVSTGLNQLLIVDQSGAVSEGQQLVSYAAPVVTKVEPIDGCVQSGNNVVDCPRSGNAKVKVHGRNFGRSSATVLISGLPCVNVTHDTDEPHQRVTCVIPQGTGLDQAVIVAQDCGSFSATGALLSYKKCDAGFYSVGKDTMCHACVAGTYGKVPGLSSCLDCPVGKFAPSTNYTTCLECDLGEHMPNTGASACFECTPGLFAALKGIVRCDSCPAGKVSRTNRSSSCELCGVGTFQGNGGQGECDACPAGEISDALGQASCTKCEVGTYTPTSGLNQCLKCQEGNVSALEVAGSTSCKHCQPGTYTNFEGLISCISCEPGRYTSFAGATTCSPCLNGTFSQATGASMCEECPVGSANPGFGQVQCQLCSSGRYSAQNRSSECTPCEIGKAQLQSGMSTCSACLEGTYQPATGQANCLPCPIGFFQNETQKTSCRVCPAGRYTVTSSQSTYCELCQPGTYSAEGAGECSNCVAGKYAESVGSTTCQDCPAGRFNTEIVSSTCQNCSTGYFSYTSGSVSCEPCDLGTYAPNNGSSTCTLCEKGKHVGPEITAKGASICEPCPLGRAVDDVGQFECIECADGRFANVTGLVQCHACPVGKIKEQVSEGATACDDCFPGTYNTIAGSFRCSPCEPGTYSNTNGSSVCQNCEEGKYQPNFYQTTCLPCGEGTVNIGTGQVKCTPCEPGNFANRTGLLECFECVSGTFASSSGQSSCTPCARGTFASSKKRATCALCPAGTATNITGQSTCVQCDKGYVAASTGSRECSKCEIGKYMNVPRQTACLLCAPGSFSNSTAATTCYSCGFGLYQPQPGQSTCVPCGRGTHAVPTVGQSSCASCSVGTYNNDTGVTKCSDCPLGTFQDTSGQTSCNKCPVGSYAVGTQGQSECKTCEPGRFANETGLYGQCHPCQLGYFQDVAGSTRCFACPSGQFAVSAVAQTSCSNCDQGTASNSSGIFGGCPACTFGKFQVLSGQRFCDDCPVGRRALNALRQTSCVSCSPGRFNNMTGVTVCQPCASGKYQEREGQTQCNDCPTGRFDSKGSAASACQKCDSGRFNGVPGRSECTDCAEGKFQFSQGQSSCDNCPTGKANSAQRQESCIDCIVGRFANETGMSSCLKCQEGRYSATQGQPECNDCPRGTFSKTPGVSTCTPCPPGEATNSTGQIACTKCIAGTIAPSRGTSVCSVCPEGRFTSVDGLTRCTDCDTGTYNAGTAATICAKCELGKFQDRVAQSGCIPCALGKKGPATQGATTCAVCGPGKYTNVTGVTECTDCELGRFIDAQGQSVCKDCGVGKYAAGVVGQSKCLDCHPGTYSDVEGLTKCTDCELGRFQPFSSRTSCSLCGTGMYALPTVGQSKCEQCVAGTYSPNEGMTQCLDCPIGFYSNKPQSAFCSACAVGLYGPAAGITKCTECQAGRFNDVLNKSVDCFKCPAGKFQTSTAQTFCRDCDKGTSSRDGAIECTACEGLTVQPETGKTACISCDAKVSAPDPFHYECICNAGLYNPLLPLTNATVISCLECPKGADCSDPGVTIDNMKTIDGFWRVDNSSLIFYRCIQPAHCVGGSTGTCGANREGVLCAICTPGTRSSTGISECTPCPSEGAAVGSSVAIILSICVALMIMYAIVLRADKTLLEKDQEQKEADIEWDRYDDALEQSIEDTQKQHEETPDLLNSADGQGVVLHGYTLSGKRKNRPNVTYKLKIFVSFFQIAVGMSFIPDIPWPSHFRNFIQVFQFFSLDFIPWQSIGCVTYFDYYEKILVVTTVPIAVLVFLVVFALLPMYYRDWKDMRDDDSYREARKRSRRKFWKLVLFTIFLMYPQVSATTLGFFVCRNVAGQEFLVQDMTLKCYDSRWMSFLGPVSFMVLLYPLGIPLGYLIILLRYRFRLRDYSVRAQLGFLYEAYIPEMWFFELIDFANKLCMVSLITFFPLRMQMPAGMVVLGVYTMIILIGRPYLRASDDRFALFANIELFLVVLAGYTLLTLEENTGLPETTDIAMSVVLIAITCAFIGIFILMVFRQLLKMWNLWRRSRNKKKFKRTKTDNTMNLKLVREASSGKMVLANQGQPVGVVDEQADGAISVYARPRQPSVSSAVKSLPRGQSQRGQQFHLNPMFVSRLANSKDDLSQVTGTLEEEFESELEPGYDDNEMWEKDAVINPLYETDTQIDNPLHHMQPNMLDGPQGEGDGGWDSESDEGH